MTLKNEVGAMKQITTYGIGLVLLFGVAAIPSNAQNQTQSNTQNPSSPSLGDYARQVRKDPEAKSKPKVFDNDNLPREEKLSVVGKPSESADNTPAAPQANESQGAAAPASGANPPADESANRLP